ncbi:MAG: glycosyltransferase [Sedimentisphaerales bacterium]|nr:glycosyltransferase [Sedimentisphaerales bacterium]
MNRACPTNNSLTKTQDQPRFSFIMIVLNGMPLIEYSLRAVYEFAHEIIVVEGAVEDAMFAANPDGSSKDGTVRFLQSFPDPAHKVRVLRGRWPEKCRMQNAALSYVTGDYVWLIDSDELYRKTDLQKIAAIVQQNPGVTQINFIPFNFWKGLEYILDCPVFHEPGGHYRRIFKYVKGAQFTTHRPPTMVWPGQTRTTEQIRLIDGKTTRNMGIHMYHYSYVLDQQVAQKTEYYARRGPRIVNGLDRTEWYDQCYKQWTPDNRASIEARYPVWIGDRRSYIEPFAGEHPEVMAEFAQKHLQNDMRTKSAPAMAEKRRADPTPKQALVSYITAPLRMGPDYHPHKFSNPGIARGLIRVLTQMGYTVDLIDYDCMDFQSQKKYDLFIGHGGFNWEYLSRNVIGDAVRIYFSTGTYWKEHNRREKQRFDDLQQRTGRRLPYDRLVKISEDFACHETDGILCLGNRDCADTYRHFDQVIHLDNAVYQDDRYDPDKKDFAAGRSHFLYFGSTGNVHKGLDRLIEAFQQTPQAHLWIAGPLEQSFAEYFGPTIEQCPNLHYVGFIELRSPQFYQLMDRCNVTILASCAEGSPGGVIECIHRGLIPILTRGCHIDVGDYGLLLADDSIETIQSTIQNVMNLSIEWHRSRSIQARKDSLARYSEQRFCENLYRGVDQIVKRSSKIRTVRNHASAVVCQDVDQYITRYADHLGFLLRAAAHLTMDQRSDDAAKVLHQAVLVEPTCVTAICELAIYWARQKNLPQAKRLIMQALRLCPNDSRCRLISQTIDRYLADSKSPVRQPVGDTSSSQSASRILKPTAPRIAADHDLHGASIKTESSFADNIRDLFSRIRPRKVIETGTFLGTGTTTVIARTLRSLGLDDAVFFTIEVNPVNHYRARQNLAASGLEAHCLNGLSVPRAMLPGKDDIRRRTVTHLPDNEIFVDHKEEKRVDLYYAETDFPNVPENLLYKCLQAFDFQPDFVLLDSAGHMGNVEFNYLIENLKGPCYIALDDIYHVKHHKSLEQIQADPRFEIIVASREKFGFCIVRFTPVSILARRNIQKLLWLRTDSIGDSILASSMLPHIAAAFRQSEISVVCQQHIAELYQACPFVKNILTVPSEHKWQNTEQYASLLRRIQQIGPDLLLNSTWAMHGMADLRGLEFIPTRIAFRNANGVSYTQCIRSEGRWKPELERHRDFLRGLGIHVAHLQPQVWTTPEDHAFAERVFIENNLHPEKTIVLFAGSRTHHRLFHQYGQALRDLCTNHNLSLIALGSATDWQVNQQNLIEAGVPRINLSGRCTLRQSAAILQRARLAVGAETGLAHMACAVGTANVILLGGGHFGRFMPYSPLTTIAALPMSCYGCDWQCRYEQVRCIMDLTPKVLTQALEQSLAGSTSHVRIFIPDNRSSADLSAMQNLLADLSSENFRLITVAQDKRQAAASYTTVKRQEQLI